MPSSPTPMPAPHVRRRRGIRSLPAVLLAGACLLLPDPARAALTCTAVQQSVDGDFNFQKQGVLKDKNGKTYKAFSTAIDASVQSNCSGDWTNPTDNWLYGEDNFLYKNNPLKYTYKEAQQAAAVRTQTQPRRYQCVDNGNTVGYYAYSRSGSTVELDFLCTVPAYQGRGYGLAMINDAIGNNVDPNSETPNFTLSILAHKAAISFYNGLTLSCSEEMMEDVQANIYTRLIAVTKGVGNAPPTYTTIDRKARCVDLLQTSTTPEYKGRIDYAASCTGLADYQAAAEGAQELSEIFGEPVFTNASPCPGEPYLYGFGDVATAIKAAVKEYGGQ